MQKICVYIIICIYIYTSSVYHVTYFYMPLYSLTSPYHHPQKCCCWSRCICPTCSPSSVSMPLDAPAHVKVFACTANVRMHASKSMQSIFSLYLWN